MNFSSKTKNENGKNKGAYKLMSYVLVFFGLFVATAILFPHAVSVVLNIIWISLFAIVIIFFTVGILVIFGLRKEASKVLDVLLEGSLTFLDLIEFIKLVYKRFVKIMVEFLLFASPVIAYIVAFIAYIILLIAYKTIGKTYDVTLFTIVLTASLVAIVGILNKPKEEKPDLEKWTAKFMDKFRRTFIDGLEVVLLIFFITMDSTKLFFLPESLNVLLRAEIFNYDLMVRSIAKVDVATTINLVIIAITTEIVRNVLRIIAVARVHYRQGVLKIDAEGSYTQSNLIKDSIRKSFNEGKDEVVKFITTLTVLFAVFMLFPRLKLLTLGVASITSLILDVAMSVRLTMVKGEDLASRLLVKVFRL